VATPVPRVVCPAFQHNPSVQPGATPDVSGDRNRAGVPCSFLALCGNWDCNLGLEVSVHFSLNPHPCGLAQCANSHNFLTILMVKVSSTPFFRPSPPPP